MPGDSLRNKRFVQRPKGKADLEDHTTDNVVSKRI